MVTMTLPEEVLKNAERVTKSVRECDREKEKQI